MALPLLLFLSPPPPPPLSISSTSMLAIKGNYERLPPPPIRAIKTSAAGTGLILGIGIGCFLTNVKLPAATATATTSTSGVISLFQQQQQQQRKKRRRRSWRRGFPSWVSFNNYHDCSAAKLLLAIKRCNKFVGDCCCYAFRRYSVNVNVNVNVGATILLFSISLALATAGVNNNSSAYAITEENLLFLEAWRTIDRAYYDKSFNGNSWFRYRQAALRDQPMNTREETYAAIRKMLQVLDDPFTRFYEPERFKSLRSGTQGALTGVGLSIAYPKPAANGPSSTHLVVLSSTPGGPADRAGIVPGDLILAIDNKSTDEMELYEAAEHLQGPEGSLVELSIFSAPTEVKTFSLKREKVVVNPVKMKMCSILGPNAHHNKVGYIKLASFNENASGAVRNAIENLRRNDVDSFVLDLRNNGGGLFPEGIQVAKIWLQKGVIVYICDSRGVRDIYEADGNDTVAATEPLVVLVNKGTASASEILAGALKDNKRAVLYGEPTYGKGKIQSVFELSDGSGLAVTVARYETPSHADINKVGVVPDHPLPTSFPLDEEDAICKCLSDPSSLCNINIKQ